MKAKISKEYIINENQYIVFFVIKQKYRKYNFTLKYTLPTAYCQILSRRPSYFPKIIKDFEIDELKWGISTAQRKYYFSLHNIHLN